MIRLFRDEELIIESRDTCITLNALLKVSGWLDIIARCGDVVRFTIDKEAVNYDALEQAFDARHQLRRAIVNFDELEELIHELHLLDHGH